MKQLLRKCSKITCIVRFLFYSLFLLCYVLALVRSVSETLSTDLCCIDITIQKCLWIDKSNWNAYNDQHTYDTVSEVIIFEFYFVYLVFLVYFLFLRFCLCCCCCCCCQSQFTTFFHGCTFNGGWCGQMMLRLISISSMNVKVVFRLWMTSTLKWYHIYMYNLHLHYIFNSFIACLIFFLHTKWIRKFGFHVLKTIKNSLYDNFVCNFFYSEKKYKENGFSVNLLKKILHKSVYVYKTNWHQTEINMVNTSEYKIVYAFSIYILKHLKTM